MNFRLVILIFAIFACLAAKADELLIVQAVSTSGKTFAIPRGSKNDIAVGQKSLFSSKTYSIMAQAIEVSQEFSLWKISKENSSVPFKKGEFINYSRYTNEVWSKISELKGIYKERDRAKEAEIKLNPYYLSAKLGLTTSFSENVSNTSTETNNSRSGYQLEFQVHKSIKQNMEMAFGLRIDQDSYTNKEPSVKVNSKRYFGIAEFTYHAEKFEKSKGNIYAALGTGYGLSETEIHTSTASGEAFILPYVKMGYLHPLTESTRLVVELQIESITANEKYASGIDQKTSIINTRFSTGIKF